PDCPNFPFSPSPAWLACLLPACPNPSRTKTARSSNLSLPTPELCLPRARKTRRPPSPIPSKTCSSSTNFPSKSAMRSSTWSTCSKADSSSPASNRCAARSPCNSALSFRPFISPTTSVSSRANTSFPCAASKSPAGKCSKTGSSPSAPNSPRPRLPEPRPASPLSASPPSGSPAPLNSGYALVDQTSVLSTHLAEIIRQHAYELLTRQETKRLLDRLAESHPKLVEELVPKLLSLGEVQKVLQQLLREQVSVRDLSTILETLLDASAINKHPVLLV